MKSAVKSFIWLGVFALLAVLVLDGCSLRKSIGGGAMVQASATVEVNGTPVVLPPKGQKALTMADLGMPLFDKGGSLYVPDLYPFDETPVFYIECGIEKYDQLFKSAAVINGTLLFTKKMLKAVADAKPEIVANFAIKPGQIPPFDAASPLYDYATKTVPQVTANVSGFVGQLMGLVQSVPMDFLGPNALKAPSVARGLKETAINLQGVAVELGALASKLVPGDSAQTPPSAPVNPPVVLPETQPQPSGSELVQPQ